jgi:ornithine cyclodeaminase
VAVEAGLGVKVVSVFAGNRALGLPTIHALVLMVDPATGVPRAVLDGTWLTALRTGAASGVATRHLARRDARVLTVFGAGVQARSQIEAVRCVRSVEEVRVVDRDGESAARLVGELGDVRAVAVPDPRDALAGADIVVTATTSPTPVFRGRDVEPGTHVNAIGAYTPETREVDGDLVLRSTVVVDDRGSALAEAGDLLIPLADGVIDTGHIRAELGDLVLGRHPGRTRPDEITFFKSVGNAVQDVAVAQLAVARAEQEGWGVLAEL